MDLRHISLAISVSVLCFLGRNSDSFQLDGPALPNRPWISVWNVDTSRCAGYGININLSHFDIVQNPNDNFTGEFMTIFYEAHFGYWPRLSKENGSVLNGGIPQLGDLNKHLQKVKQDIETTIPDPDFEGLAVIDFESYKPNWDENWDTEKVYRDMSVALVKKQHPDWPDDEIESEAKRQFESAAKNYMLKSLEYAISLRPHGHWGYYHYPYCHDGKVQTLECPQRSKDFNNREVWLFNTTEALYPSTYMHASHPAPARPKILHAEIEEAFRVAYNGTNHLPVFAYTKFQYNERVPYWFYTHDDLVASLTVPADFGSAGSVIWATSLDFIHPRGCQLLQAFIDKEFGPLVLKVTEFTVACSKDLCSNNGRCVRRSYFPNEESPFENPIDAQRLQESSVVEVFDMGPYADYMCHCYRGWSGEHCDKSTFYKTL